MSDPVAVGFRSITEEHNKSNKWNQHSGISVTDSERDDDLLLFFLMMIFYCSFRNII
jgi:hypothetical protein